VCRRVVHRTGQPSNLARHRLSKSKAQMALISQITLMNSARAALANQRHLRNQRDLRRFLE
jgi:hypothetical protein